MGVTRPAYNVQKGYVLTRIKRLLFFLILFLPLISLHAQFQVKDTVCVNSSVIITNTISNASTYYWSFCQADINTVPVGNSLGNVNNVFSVPAYIDYAFDNGHYYGFLTNNSPGGLVRLDFGNSLLNAPTAAYLGNFGSIPDGCQGIQVVKEGNNWYALIAGGDPGANSTPRILRAAFGTSLANTPTVTNWGNIGNLAYPHDLYVFKDVNNWYGFVANYANSTITRFSFGTDFTGTPTAVNLGTLGGINGPTGLCPINDNGIWRLFVTSFNGNTLSRIDFGNSLLNTPSGSANLGNPGNLLFNPRDILIVNYCSQSVAFIGNDNSDVTKLNFSTLTSTPTFTNLGKIGGPGNIHSVSKLFRTGADLFVFMPNSYSNNLTRLRFPGCSNATVASSTLQTPPAFSYNTPGTYNISLTVDDGLPTQATYCKTIVVATKKPESISADVTVCVGNAATLQATGADVYEWLNKTDITNTADSSVVVTPVTTTSYKVRLYNNTCAVNDTLTTTVTVNPKPVVAVTKSNDIDCSNATAQLSATGSGTFQWLPVTGLSDPTIANPVAAIAQTTKYYLTVTNSAGCSAKDSVIVQVSGNTSTDRYMVPTAFTPNGDGLNDCFGVKEWGNISNLEFSIYNRWGERIFFTTNSANCWDGRYKSYPQEQGTYIYHIKFHSLCGDVDRKGTFVLIR